MKTDLFLSCAHCWVFQICWHVEYSTFTASSFRIWNSSTGIPSPPLALFIVMLPMAHLTSHSRMSGSRWVITPLWLSGSWRSFLCMLTPTLWDPWTVTRQAPLSWNYPGKNSGVCCHLLPCGNFPNPGIKPASPESPMLGDGFFTTEPLGNLNWFYRLFHFILTLMWSGN